MYILNRRQDKILHFYMTLYLSIQTKLPYRIIQKGLSSMTVRFDMSGQDWHTLGIFHSIIYSALGGEHRKNDVIESVNSSPASACESSSQVNVLYEEVTG